MGTENLKKIKNLVEELTIRDLDVIKKSQETDILKEIFLKSPQAMAIMENDWKYVMVNENFAKIYGFQCSTEMEGKNHHELFNSIPERPISEIIKTLESGGTWTGSITLPHKDNGTFQTDVCIEKLKNKDVILFTIKK